MAAVEPAQPEPRITTSRIMMRVPPWGVTSRAPPCKNTPRQDGISTTNEGGTTDGQQETVRGASRSSEPGDRPGDPGFGAIHVAARPLERHPGVRGEGRLQGDRHLGDEARRGDRGATELPRGNPHHETGADLSRHHAETDDRDRQEGRGDGDLYVQ